MIAMTSSTAPTQYSRFSLTDELAEATSELLDLGGAARQHPSSYSHAHRPPLPTPSPLNLSAPQTLSSIVSQGKTARLELIYDDDDRDDRSSSAVKRKSETASSSEKGTQAEAPFDQDDKLPSSRLNSLIASVSDKTLHSMDTAMSPNIRAVEDALHDPTWSSRRGKARQPDASSRVSSLSTVKVANETPATHRDDQPPSFFTESFPDFKVSPGTEEAPSSKNVSVPKQTSPKTAQKLASPRPTNPTIGEVFGSNVTVKLHGNGRLQRESHEPSNQINDDDVLQEVDPQHYSDDGERSSLMSLPATSITDSSQNSSRGGTRQRPIRRRSNGSYSVTSVDVSMPDDVVFARDVQVRGFNVVGEKARGFVCYDVRVITTTGTTISILRRFRSFCQLRQALVNERPLHAKLVPALPPKTTGLLHKYASHHLEKRRKGLQKWLSIVMLDRRWATTKALREWVVGD